MKKTITVIAALLGAVVRIAAQESEAAAPAADQAGINGERLRLATSSIDYPATPGDVYRLSYRQTDVVVVMDVPLESDYTMDLQVFGRINAAGMTFAKLKQSIEDKITAGYPRSLPSVTIESTGIFRVYVRGETPQACYVTAWGLTRLSDVVENVRGPYSSIRSVQVIPQTGDPKRYDLEEALRFGQPAQDPLVRPGDTIVLYRADRIVEISGAVYQPGRYELTPGEGLRELVNRYGGGTTSAADLTNVRFERTSIEGAIVDYITLPGAFDTNGRLLDRDRIVIASYTERLPVVFFEGAVIPSTQSPAATAALGTTAAQAVAATSQSRLIYPFRKGETLSAAYRNIMANIASYADVSAATLIRTEEPQIKTVNLLLVGQSQSSPDIVLRPNDRIVIPSLMLYVSVQGAVFAPASYPYQAGYSALAYISLAGGIDPERNANGTFSLSDSNGKAKKITDLVLPGDKVYVPSNRFGYNLNRLLPVVSSILTLVVTSTTLAIQINAFITNGQ